MGSKASSSDYLSRPQTVRGRKKTWKVTTMAKLVANVKGTLRRRHDIEISEATS